MDLRDWLVKRDKTGRSPSTDAATDSERPNKKRKISSTDDDVQASAPKKVGIDSGASKYASHNEDMEEVDDGKAQDVECQTSKHDSNKRAEASDVQPSDSQNKDDNANEGNTNGDETNSKIATNLTSNSKRPVKTQPQTLEILETIDDLFTAPPNTLIIHACNCRGSWGGGIAAAFRKHYPNAYKHYNTHCEKYGFYLMGKAQLIPPVETDSKKHFVGCLYTSRRFGRAKDTPEMILEATGPAMEDLLKQVKVWNEKHGEEEKVAEVRMCLINSGLFAVDWSKTKEALESIDVDKYDVKMIIAMDRE